MDFFSSIQASGAKGRTSPGEIDLDVLLQGHVLGVPEGRVGLRLAAFQDGLAAGVLQGAFHRDFGIAKVGGIENFADLALGKIAVQTGDLSNGAFRNVVAFVAQGLAALFVQAVWR